MTDAIIARGLVKTYGSVKAVDDLDVVVPEGTVMGLLGPNGAGKTTTVRMLTTLIAPNEGEITIKGIDVVAKPNKVREIIGVSGQYAAVDENLTGYENLEMVGRLYHLGKAKARKRAHELLERFDLTEAANRPSKTYSGGMRRRLDLAGALVAAPPVLFLDEPTTGLDPRSRVGMWDVINELVAEGTTLLLTTQYLEEADELAEDIIVIDHGKAIAHGTPDQLKRQIGGERLEITLHSKADASAVVQTVDALGMSGYTVDDETHKISIPVTDGTEALFEAVRRLDEASVKPADIGIHRPTLDDVFMRLTGHAAEESEDEETKA
ncbi:daunorubicin resistance protein DrrA family ABC transporter ATP-binding protein [Stackebrandtia nassauensis]|uniref:Daunorubicin resistance ABC transporter ATPase subunit n=1 Tax=Stackebrandtia nassauensis (strain DSM 44728 / CIP 108903 / NRRL B-16338 / NBRC 102104 / LLR-40K-21) TaxID=446470 RepID=D3PYG9_STANL|nr:daunorubicin resistance protein DrrA family ABC transporter ATP-binding protein [Stackebrandtia nassauensis]ADD41536.1 daunorubicin resistance ABC transporter ATPase subunit [Stackebrandtia nassauensis DSM 44728]